MRWLILMSLAGCHLAETVDPPTCPPKSHLQSGQCVADPVEGPLVTIASCVVTPDPSSPTARLAGARWWGYVPVHTNLLPRKTLRELLSVLGLVIS